LKPFAEVVTQKLGEILIAHGRPPLTDPRLCENLLKDYCGEYKEEISILVCAVRERIAIDLLISRDGIPRDLLRSLLISRLRKNGSLSESAAQWAVDSWNRAVLNFTRSESEQSATEGVLPVEDVVVDPNLTAGLAAIANTRDASRPSLPKKPIRPGILGSVRNPIRAIAVSPLGDRIVSGGDDCTIRLWQVHSGDQTILGECDGPVAALAFSPNGVMIASASEDGSIRVWDLQSGEALTLGAGGKRSPSVVFSPGGKSLASASAEADGVLQVWNLQTGQSRILKSELGPSSISFAPDGSTIAAAEGTLSHATIRLWDLETGTARVLGQSNRQITAVAFSPAGESLASGGWDETVRLWNIRTGAARVLGKNCSCISTLAFSPNGDAVAACSLDNKVRVWNVATAKSRTVGECQSVNDVAFLADGRTLVTASADGTLRLWDASL